MELWDIYDENRTRTGRFAVRDKDVLKAGEYHLVVHVAIFSDDGRMLIQRRAEHKTDGGKWDISVGGSAVAGETSKEAAKRELFEELGLTLPIPRPAFTVNFPEGFDEVFLLRAEPEISSLVLQEEEVMDAKWAEKEEIFALLDAGNFVHYRRHFLELLFEMNCEYGILLRG